MSEQSIELKNYRMQQKRDSTQKWADSSFVPRDGEIIVYKDEDSVNRIKIGDGKSSLDELKFITGEIYVQEKQPEDAGEGAIWINPDETQSNDELSDIVVSGALTIAEQTYTISLTLKDGSVETHMIETDENNYPTKMIINGVTIPWTVNGG